MRGNLLLGAACLVGSGAAAWGETGGCSVEGDGENKPRTDYGETEGLVSRGDILCHLRQGEGGNSMG